MTVTNAANCVAVAGSPDQELVRMAEVEQYATFLQTAAVARERPILSPDLKYTVEVEPTLLRIRQDRGPGSMSLNRSIVLYAAAGRLVILPLAHLALVAKP